MAYKTSTRFDDFFLVPFISSRSNAVRAFSSLLSHLFIFRGTHHLQITMPDHKITAAEVSAGVAVVTAVHLFSKDYRPKTTSEYIEKGGSHLDKAHKYLGRKNGQAEYAISATDRRDLHERCEG